jgi:uncharacterized membrane protein
MVKQFIIILMPLCEPINRQAMWIQGIVNRKTEINNEIAGNSEACCLTFILLFIKVKAKIIYCVFFPRRLSEIEGIKIFLVILW